MIIRYLDPEGKKQNPDNAHRHTQNHKSELLAVELTISMRSGCGAWHQEELGVWKHIGQHP